MKDVPNARTIRKMEDGEEVKYESNVGGALKVRYVVEREKGFVTFNPSHLHVEFNGMPIEFLQSLSIKIDNKGFPTARLGFKLTSLDIDMDSLLSFQAIIQSKQGS